jgi:glutamate N-acetyltransferase/amino-acid N-acetyltransferase
MAIGLKTLSRMFPVDGVRLAVAEAGVRYQGRNDVVLIACDEGSICAGVFTRNAFCAAPVVIARQHMAFANTRALLINSGNANAGTGEPGMQAALACCASAAQAMDCQAQQVLPFSTGVIGELLPAEKIQAVLPAMVEQLHADRWPQAAAAIMTTDTVAKGASVKFELAGESVTLTGIAKGSGMIRPDMATMLAFIATDADIEQALLQECLQQAVEASFNRITVDGDTSTNDACMLLATGRSGVQVSRGSKEQPLFVQALGDICLQLAQSIIRDGEGVTKFISVQVEQGADQQECLDVAYTVAHSPLVKTAFFASDPNWGRILAAVGRAGIKDMLIDDISIYLDGVCIVEHGGRASSYTEEQGQAVMAQEEISIRICLGRGHSSETVWTTDLSYDYVKINAEYRT